jgi:hypothetical protein
MGAPNFDIPQGMQDIIAILNASDLWNVTVVRRDERLYLYDGDQMVFVADTQQETNAFLSGAFLATYNL